MIRIITDSSSDLSKKYCEDHNVAMIPLIVNFGEKAYRDGVDLTKEEFYDLLESSKVIPTTSLAGPVTFVEEYNKYPDDDIIVLVISSGLSSTMQSAILAKEETKRDNITVIDSQQTTVGLALIVEYAVSLINQGKSYEEVIDILKEVIPRVEIRGIINTLKYLVKGGRLSKVSGAVGSVLSIKPIINCYDGVLNTVGKARGFKSAAKMVGEHVRKNFDPKMPIKFVTSYSAVNLDFVRDEFPELSGDVISLGPVVGSHIGKGSAGIAYFNKK